MAEIGSIQPVVPVRPMEHSTVQQRPVEAGNETVAHRTLPTGSLTKQDGFFDTVQQQEGKEGVKAAIETAQRQIQFAVDNETRRMIIKIIDPTTKEVIRQIPPEEALRISRMISQMISDRGAVTDERV
ncbi:MAG: flagellar protein FlaG [Bacteroidota bacterium]|nr:flagellar protein FlaG [Candidatus Kapabacteria bacterium]MCS7303424.1 flagellar protein FlaG [Candidatus Kapabacteria bacterium]MCX7937140.1 flagellar protein FlaG [Chlorobiota bacterium]MDW8075217.1 flagellar protein FlaG [Bacteroidota bacterium]MDW8271830.1 flagellar protein FlaG [Bacteroidota bacterium]